MMRLPAACGPDGKWSRCGVSAFSKNVSPVWRINPARGDPELFPPEVVVTVKALACEPPARARGPLERERVGGRHATERARGVHQREHDLALAARGRDSPVVPPQLDLSARSTVWDQGRSDPRSVRAHLGRATPDGRR